MSTHKETVVNVHTVKTSDYCALAQVTADKTAHSCSIPQNSNAHNHKSSDFTSKVVVYATNAETQLLALFQINVHVNSLAPNIWPDSMQTLCKSSIVLEVRKQ
jgi:hypothetical protein